MPRLGSGDTTDNTQTDNTIYRAGESRRLAYDVGVGTGSKRVQTDLTGFTLTASVIAVEVVDGDIATALPLGTCTISGTDTRTIRDNCTEGTWVQDTPTDLTVYTDAAVSGVNLAEGKFFAFMPKTILAAVGYVAGQEPRPDELRYIAYVAAYEEPSAVIGAEFTEIETDVIGFRWSPTFTL